MLTASRPLNRARQAERQSEQEDRQRKPLDQGRAQVTSLPLKLKIGRPGRKSSRRGGKASGSTKRASRDLPKASRPSEGRERYERKPREVRLPKKSTKGHRSSGSKVSVNKSSKCFHYSEGQSKTYVIT